MGVEDYPRTMGRGLKLLYSRRKSSSQLDLISALYQSPYPQPMPKRSGGQGSMDMKVALNTDETHTHTD